MSRGGSRGPGQAQEASGGAGRNPRGPRLPPGCPQLSSYSLTEMHRGSAYAMRLQGQGCWLFAVCSTEAQTVTMDKAYSSPVNMRRACIAERQVVTPDPACSVWPLRGHTQPAPCSTPEPSLQTPGSLFLHPIRRPLPEGKAHNLATGPNPGGHTHSEETPLFSESRYWVYSRERGSPRPRSLRK